MKETKVHCIWGEPGRYCIYKFCLILVPGGSSADTPTTLSQYLGEPSRHDYNLSKYLGGARQARLHPKSQCLGGAQQTRLQPYLITWGEPSSHAYILNLSVWGEPGRHAYNFILVPGGARQAHLLTFGSCGQDIWVNPADFPCSAFLHIAHTCKW